jgi:glutaredoxin
LLTLNGKGHALLSRVSGADTTALTTAVTTHDRVKTAIEPRSTSQVKMPEPARETPEELEARLRRLMNQSKVVLFMKGNPGTPRCGFSKKTCALLKEQNVEFTHFDILTDEDVRQGDSI